MYETKPVMCFDYVGLVIDQNCDCQSKYNGITIIIDRSVFFFAHHNEKLTLSYKRKKRVASRSFFFLSKFSMKRNQFKTSLKHKLKWIFSNFIRYCRLVAEMKIIELKWNAQVAIFIQNDAITSKICQKRHKHTRKTNQKRRKTEQN